MNRDQFLAAALKNSVNEKVTHALDELALPDAWLVSGCLVQTVWNVMTGRAADYGINDYDVFYFDPDSSWEAEDTVIRKLDASLAGLGAIIQTRNQARVHLWYGQKHGMPYPPLRCSTEGIDRFLTANTPWSASAVSPAATRSMRRTASTTSPRWWYGLIQDRIFRREITQRKSRDGKECGRRSR